MCLNDENARMTAKMISDINSSKTEISEFIIVDNASTHGVEEMKNGADIYLKQEKNRGWGGGINVGMSIAKGDYFVFANNDIEVKPGWAEKLIARFESNPKIGTISMNERGGFSGAFFAIRREIYEKIGEFDETNFPLGHAQDCDYLYRLMKEGWDDNVLLLDGYKHHCRKTYNQKEFKDKYLHHVNFSKSDFHLKWGFKEMQWEARGHADWTATLLAHPEKDRFNEYEKIKQQYDASRQNLPAKTLIVSYDDLWEGNDHWEEFEKLADEFPGFKVTFFVITGKCSEKFLKKIQKPWAELVFHSWEHSGLWQHWSKNETKTWLQKYSAPPYNFKKGFKAPAYKMTDNIQDACDELDYWIVSSPTIPTRVKKHWYTYPSEGIMHYESYSEAYGHLQNKDFSKLIDDVRQFCKTHNVTFKFISEVIITQ